MTNYFYEIWLLGYDENGYVTAEEEFIGNAETEEDALEIFDRCDKKLPNSYSTHILCEQCVSNDFGVTCVDIVDEREVM